jgi:hypothetical protein
MRESVRLAFSPLLEGATMMHAMKSHPIGKLRLGTLLAAALVLPALAQTDDENSRGVRIIDAPVVAPAQSPLPESPASALPQLEVPAAPAPSPLVSAPPEPELTAPAPAAALPAPAPAAALPAPAPAAALPPAAAPTVSTRITVPDEATATYNVMSAPPNAGDLGTPPKQIDFAALQSNVKVANAAAVAVDIIPGPNIAVGSRVSFRISTKKAGYLILVDVDAAGKLTQIYPNPISLLANSAGRQNANYLKPGKSVLIPNPADPFAGFEFVAAAPFGTAMVVAILSDRPVQLVDLPDIPDSLTGQASAVAFLTKLAGDLRIPEGDGGRLQEARWSFDAKFYAIR